MLRDRGNDRRTHRGQRSARSMLPGDPLCHSSPIGGPALRKDPLGHRRISVEGKEQVDIFGIHQTEGEAIGGDDVAHTRTRRRRVACRGVVTSSTVTNASGST